MLTATLRRSAQLMILAGLYLSILDSAQAQTAPLTVKLQTVNGQYVAASGGAVNAGQDIIGGGTTFTLIDLNGGRLKSGDKVQFRTEQGTYLVAEGGGGREVKADRTVASDWETFTIRRLSPLSTVVGIDFGIDYGIPFVLQAFNGQYVTAESGGGGNVNANRPTADLWETFMFQGMPYDATNCPICNQMNWELEWTDAMDHSGGVAAKDILGHRIGRPDPYKTFSASEWHPNAVVKQTVCGTVQRFFYYNEFGGGNDWNINLLPYPPYSFAISDVLDRYQAELHRKHYEIDAQGNTKTWTLEEKWKKFKQEARPDLCRPTDPNMKYACDGEDHPYYMQAEVTPDERFYQNSWFALNDPDDPPNAVYDSEADGKSPLVGKNLCTYGPWVRDHGHGKRPEIHPAELLWWREGDSRYLLMQVQDDSNRFDVPLQFEGAGKCRTWDSINSVCDESVVLDEYQAWFRPWAEPPRVSQFRIAFEVDLPSPVGTQLPAYNIPVFDIRELALLRQEAFPDVSHPRVQPHVSDTTPGTDHAVTFNFKVGPFLQKRTVLQVRERVRFSNLLGVRFNQICRDPVRKKLRGFVQLTSAIGRDSKGKEGYQVLGVSRELYPSQGSGPITLRAIKSESPSVRAPLFPRVSAKAKLASGSLRRVEVDGRPQLVADIEVTLTAPEGQPSDKLAITKAEQGDGGQRVVRALKRPDPLPGVGTHGVNPSAVVQKVALNRTSTLAVILQSGEKVKIPLSSTLSLNPRLRTRPLPHPKVDSANWEAWAHATGAPLTSPLPTHMSLLHPPHWEVDMTPVYAPLKEGEPSIEEESPIAEELHEAIRKRNPERLAKVFGSSQPLTIQWSYAATNLITGQAVSVTTNASANPAAVRVAITDGPIPSGTLRITFPNQSKPDLYELVVTATISDTLGNTGSFSERIWSHYLGGTASGRMANPLLQVIAALGGLSPQDVVAALTPLDDDTAVQIAINERLRQLHTLRLFAEEAAEDQVVSFEEFSGLLGMAKNIAGTAK